MARLYDAIETANAVRLSAIAKRVRRTYRSSCALHVSHADPKPCDPCWVMLWGEHLRIKDNQQTRCESPR